MQDPLTYNKRIVKLKSKVLTYVFRASKEEELLLAEQSEDRYIANPDYIIGLREQQNCNALAF